MTSVTIPSFYINLDRRPDRREYFENECKKMNITVERFPAIEHSFPALGCNLSHLEVLKLARERKYPSVMIFEDDFEFIVSKEEFTEICGLIPDDFDVVMIGYNLYHATVYNNTFAKVTDARTASGYIVNSKFYDTLISNWEEASSLMANNLNRKDYVPYANDKYWIRLQAKSNWFSTLKRVGKQREGYSDLEKTYVNYGI